MSVHSIAFQPKALLSILGCYTGNDFIKSSQIEASITTMQSYTKFLQRMKNSSWLTSNCTQLLQINCRAFATGTEASEQGTSSGRSREENTKPTTGNPRVRAQSTGSQHRDSAAKESVARSLLSLFDQTPVSTVGPENSTPYKDSTESISSGLLAESEAETNDVIKLVLRAVDNCKPVLKVKQYKDGNRAVNIPYMVHPREQRSLAIRWILNAAHKRRESSSGPYKPSIAECLATELLLAARKEGSARAKRDEMHKLAVENRAAVGKRLS